jgi:hypothetical protein
MKGFLLAINEGGVVTINSDSQKNKKYIFAQNALAETQERRKKLAPNDKDALKYKDLLTKFVQSFRWDLFVTIGVGHCPDDDEARRRFRLIEAKLNKTFVHREYHRLAEADRFWGIIAFEGERERGDRHCHLLLYVPNPKRGELSRDTLIGKLPLWIRILWNNLSEKPWAEPSDWSSFRLKCRYPAWFWNGIPSFYYNGYEWCERENKPLTTLPCRCSSVLAVLRLSTVSYLVGACTCRYDRLLSLENAIDVARGLPVLVD